MGANRPHRVISRPIVILLAFVAAVMRASQGAWLAASGLVALGTGLIFLRVAPNRPIFRRAAWACFAVTAVAMVIVVYRQYR